MSKYWIFVNMKTCIILIILGFTQLGICSDLSNITYDDSYPVCPIKFFRKKRAVTEYTRWRANIETTPEFLVKVLDEDLTTPHTKPVVAINIQPVTKSVEKIIIGGVGIASVTTAPPSAGTRDYTRFIPPTTVPVTRVGEELYLALAPVSRSFDKVPPLEPKRRHSQRDESPPIGPQFLARTSALYAQFAPIAPVAFTQKATNLPLRPPSPSSHPHPEPLTFTEEPTRTINLPDIIWPTRTEYTSEKEYKPFQDLVLDDFEESSTSSSTKTISRTTQSPKRTSIITEALFDEENDIRENRQPNYEENRRFDDETKKNNEKSIEKADKEADAFYNTMFYNDDYAESSSKKSDPDQIESYDEKGKLHYDIDTKTENVDVTDAPLTRTPETARNFDYMNEYERNVTRIPPLSPELTTVFVQTSTHTSSKDKVRGKRRPDCNLIKLRQLNFNSPRTLPEIVSQLKLWAEKSPLAKWEDITRGNLTTMENPIYMMIVDDPSSGQIVSAKQTVMVLGGIQGRDHHAVAAAMYVLYQLIERSEAHTDLLKKFRFWIIPVFNPDGYDYSKTFPHRREWSKNLRQYWDICKSRESCASCGKYGLRCSVQPCYGVNLDRNFEYQWIPPEELRAEHPCGALHAGPRQLSEPETWALTHFLHEQRTPLYAFIAFKEGEVLGIMYPYSHTRKLRAFDHVYRQRASRASAAAYSINGRPYVAGQTSEFLPLYAGGVEDWVDGHLGIDNTYTIMMFRPTDSYGSKLITERVVHEAYAAMDTLLLQSIEPLGPPSVLKSVNGAPKLVTRCLVFVSLISIFKTIVINRLIKILIINE